MARHNLLGKRGEMLAARYLLGQGLAILEYNWRSGHKEVDLIAKERDVYVFVEVKTRRNENYGDVREAVTDRKMQNIITAAEAYVESHDIDAEIRFDVVTVVPDGDSYSIEHIRDAFYPEIE
ncbi:MAG: YraN family protein [Bacteroidaceae bacterium]|jgi:putative endonuclease|nr:YraN family protein [Bacteroidaceae bacterium]MBR5275887.1 YraN family protein [Bacteroidaceae bacterium]MBR5890940.1 YraN family protein [Bacteroidaceae bacterium]